MVGPDGVEVDRLGEGAEEGKDVDNLGGVRWQLGLVDAGRELGWRLDVEGERDVLGDVAAAVGERVVTDVGAERVAGIAGLGGGGKCVVHLLPYGEAYGRRGFEVGVVAAGVERSGDVEKGLAGFKRDRGAAGFGLGDARGGGTHRLLAADGGCGGFRLDAAGRPLRGWRLTRRDNAER